MKYFCARPPQIIFLMEQETNNFLCLIRVAQMFRSRISVGVLYTKSVIPYPLFFSNLSLIPYNCLSLIFSIYPLSLTFFNLSLIPYNYYYPLSLIFSHFYPLSLIIFHFYPLSLKAAAPLFKIVYKHASYVLLESVRCSLQ